MLDTSVDLAMRDAFRHFPDETQGLSEDEAIFAAEIGLDFGITQVVDGNLGTLGIDKKALFAGRCNF